MKDDILELWIKRAKKQLMEIEKAKPEVKSWRDLKSKAKK